MNRVQAYVGRLVLWASQMVLLDVLVNCSIHRRGFIGNTRPRLCKVRSKRFWGASICGNSYKLSLIGVSSSTMSPERESHQCNKRERACHQQCNKRSRTCHQCINLTRDPTRMVGTRGGKLNQSREGQQRVGVHQKIPATRGRQTSNKLTKTENFVIMIRIMSWLPIWAQAAWSTFRRVAMAHTVK